MAAKKKGADAPTEDEHKNLPVNARALAKRAKEGDEDALKAMEKIVVCFERWKKALAEQREANRSAKELEGGAQATFEQAVEEALPTEPGNNAIWEKLRHVEQTWQERQEAIAEASEIRSAAADKVKKRGAELERAMQDGAQLTIPGTD